MVVEDGQANYVTIISGSARPDGNTASPAKHLKLKLGPSARICDLSQLTVEPFKYDCHDDRDDFRFIVAMVLESEHIVFASPVYWYSMSAPLKAFFDRLTDLLHDPTDRLSGRALVGRNVWLMATGTDNSLPVGFYVPFARTAEYFAMVWRGAFYSRSLQGTSRKEPELAETDRLAHLIAADDA